MDPPLLLRASIVLSHGTIVPQLWNQDNIFSNLNYFAAFAQGLVPSDGFTLLLRGSIQWNPNHVFQIQYTSPSVPHGLGDLFNIFKGQYFSLNSIQPFTPLHLFSSSRLSFQLKVLASAANSQTSSTVLNCSAAALSSVFCAKKTLKADKKRHHSSKHIMVLYHVL